MIVWFSIARRGTFEKGRSAGAGDIFIRGWKGDTLGKILIQKRGENIDQLLSIGRLLPQAMADDVFATYECNKK